ncbi:hypothetical protein PV04_00659 [Phialophora macrospora]|uniref:Glucose-methanol-choline oxidoreductase C-terminal domain-containing protein n=1 Tax=Phialophora macrospora TaxID=1851006 RepID=A0A0D2FVG2_9EURO|nr:hypothetical protein PV04_00659 [Phialophora macrospora]
MTRNPNYMEGTDRVAGSTTTISEEACGSFMWCHQLAAGAGALRGRGQEGTLLESAAVAVVEDLLAVGNDYQVHNTPKLLDVDFAGFEVPVEAYVSVAPYTAYPSSRGKLHVTGPNWEGPIDFDLGFSTDTHDVDLQKQIWACKKYRAKMYRGELANIEYSGEDEQVIENFTRENIQTTWHVLGPAKMALHELADRDLNVYGVQSLKVADLSIEPQNVAANTGKTALQVGETVASIVLAEQALTEKTDPKRERDTWCTSKRLLTSLLTKYR